MHMSFRGVVGYHVRLTRERSPVRTRTKAICVLVLNCTCRMSTCSGATKDPCELIKTIVEAMCVAAGHVCCR